MEEGVLLLNMGGPSHLGEVEIFLKNMFADPYILTTKSTLMRKILSKIIVNSRLEKAKNIYRSIGGKSPLKEITFKLTKKLHELDPKRFYSYVMRYTPPYADLALEEMRQKGVKKLYLFSMYPQFSSATTLSSFTDVRDSLMRLKYFPEIYSIDRYFDHSMYIGLCVDLVLESMEGHDTQEFILVFSAHSLPVSFIKNQDPYQEECERSFELIKDEFKKQGIRFRDIKLSYQSKVGPVKWIGPSTKDTISSLGGSKVIVSPLGFSIDNSETVYEIGIQYRKLAEKVGVKKFINSPCPNDDLRFAELILNLIAHKEGL